MTDNGSPADPNAHLHNLAYSDQIKIARSGGQTDRTVLERLYGKPVWEALLANPQITVAEVAHIACKGGLPQHLIDAIAGNATWALNAQVRRGLLTNPRLGRSHVERLLRAMPAHELKLVAKQSIYGPTVREAARKLSVAGG
jgi:hypothetical protein